MKVGINLTNIILVFLVYALFNCAREKHWEKLAQCRAAGLENCEQLYPGF